MVPTIRTVRCLDPNGYAKGVIQMFEVVDLFDEETDTPYASCYTETEAEDVILDLIHS